MLYKLATTLSRRQKQVALLTADILVAPVALLAAIGLSGLTSSWADVVALARELVPALVTMMAVGALMSLVLGIPRIQLKAYDADGIVRTFLLGIGMAVVGDVTARMLSPGIQIGPLMALFALTFLVLDVGTRFALRTALIAAYRRGMPRQKVLIYGAGQTGLQLATALKRDDRVEVVAFVDDNPSMQNLRVAGLPVESPVRLSKLVQDHGISRVVLAMPSASRAHQARVAAKLQAMGLEVRTLPSFAALVGSSDLASQMRPIGPDGLLGRKEFDCDRQVLQAFYGGASVMVTGAGGSIGSELVRQVLSCAPARLVLYEVSEAALFALTKDLGEMPGAEEVAIVPVLGSVTDARHLSRTMVDHGVSIVLHAAAYKHVPLVEENPLPGLQNNALGTKTCAEVARDVGVAHFVLVSTDKAVRPASVMGASKRLSELVLQDLARRSDRTRFSIVRFGNVLGSSGSVIPLFQEQISRGGPVTITHPAMTRYFMTVSEAARLVLMAGSMARGGEIFVLDMGQPVSIVELARRMIAAAGYTVADADNPDGDIEIRVTGPRPGEKLHEEITSEGQLGMTGHPKILTASEPVLSEIEVAAAMRAIGQAIESGDAGAALAALGRWVPGFRSVATTPEPERTEVRRQSGTLSIPEPPQG